MVSVVVPAYQAESFIRECIESVLGQSMADLELVIVDDGSEDDTAAIVRRFDDPRLELIEQSNRGANAARNVGLARTTAPFIAFLDADDTWDPSKLDRQLEVITEDPDVVAVGAFMRYLSSRGRVLGTTGYIVGPAEERLISHGRLVPFTLSSTLFRTHAVREVGGFDERLPAAQDLDLLARIIPLGRFATVEEVLGSYRLHRGSLTMLRFRLQRTAVRFVRARLEARRSGGDLAWEDFISSYRPTMKQRYGDLVQWAYRSAGLGLAERDWLTAVRFGVLAGLLGPRYTFIRMRHQLWRSNSGTVVETPAD